MRRAVICTTCRVEKTPRFAIMETIQRGGTENMKKTAIRILSVILCLSVITGCTVAVAAAETASGTYGNINWNLDARGTLTLTLNHEPEAPADDPTATPTDVYDDYYYYHEDYKTETFDRYATLIRNVDIGEGITGSEPVFRNGTFLRCTKINEFSIPSTFTFGLSKDIIATLSGALSEEIDEAVSESGEDGSEIKLNKDTEKLVSALLATFIYEDSAIMTLPLSAGKFKVAPGNEAYKSEKGNLMTADGNIVLRHSRNTRTVNLDLVPFIDPIALIGLSKAEISISDAYANAVYGAKDAISEVLKALAETYKDEENKSIKNLINDLIPAVDEFFDLIFTVELSLCSAKSFSVADTNQYLSVENGILYNKDKSSLIKYPVDNGETSYRIPESVKKLSMPFATINVYNAIALAVDIIYGTLDYEKLDVQKTVDGIIVTPENLNVQMTGEQFASYYNGDSYIEKALFNYVRDMFGNTDEDFEARLESTLATTGAKVALGLVKIIGIGKIIIDEIPDEYRTGIAIYNGFIDALHDFADVLRALSKADRKATKKAVSELLSNDLLVQFYGEDTVKNLTDFSDSIFEEDYSKFRSTLPGLVDFGNASIELAYKAEFLDKEDYDKAVLYIACAKSVLADPSYTNWCAENKKLLDAGALSREEYDRNISKEYYDENIADLEKRIEDLFDEAVETVNSLFEKLKDPANKQMLSLLRIIADAIDAVAGLFPDEIVEAPRIDIAGFRAGADGTYTRDAAYNSTITFTAAANVPDDHIEWWFAYEGESFRLAGHGPQYTVEKAKKSYTIQCRVYDDLGNTEVKTEVVNIKSDFFNRISSFFRFMFSGFRWETEIQK